MGKNGAGGLSFREIPRCDFYFRIFREGKIHILESDIMVLSIQIY